MDKDDVFETDTNPDVDSFEVDCGLSISTDDLLAVGDGFEVVSEDDDETEIFFVRGGETALFLLAESVSSFEEVNVFLVVNGELLLSRLEDEDKAPVFVNDERAVRPDRRELVLSGLDDS